ncbi:MAG TPA: phosphoribosylformylglycinamidine synthase, partial [Candidatus Hydrogenedentes bacterium]|nr:phosphoribosylformylglycinamidine synthase [Candidatus Hydrogenedentota bacterium]
MPTHRIEVALRPEFKDPAGEALRAQVREDLNLEIGAVRVIDVFTLHAALTAEELERIRMDLFTDPIIEYSAVNASLAENFSCLIEVGYLPGVTDNAGRSAQEGIEDSLGRKLAQGEAVYKSTLYVFQDTDAETAKTIASNLLANELIEQYAIRTPEEMKALAGKSLLALPRVVEYAVPEVESIDLNLSDDALQQLSRDRMFALELGEMQVIRDYYNRADVQAHR